MSRSKFELTRSCRISLKFLAQDKDFDTFRFVLRLIVLELYGNFLNGSNSNYFFTYQFYIFEPGSNHNVSWYHMKDSWRRLKAMEWEENSRHGSEPFLLAKDSEVLLIALYLSGPRSQVVYLRALFWDQFWSLCSSMISQKSPIRYQYFRRRYQTICSNEKPKFGSLPARRHQ